MELLASEALSPTSSARSVAGGGRIESDTPTARVLVMGDADSGRTSLASSAPRVSSRPAASFLRRAAVRKTAPALRFVVDDGGPLPLRGGASRRSLPHAAAVLVAFPVTGVKQRGAAAAVHRRDTALLRDLLAAVAAPMRRGARRPLVALVATHRDLLADASRAGVEAVMRELRAVCAELSTAVTLQYVFAVNTTDGTCVSENRGGPETVTAMWAFLSDVLLKEAAARQRGSQTGEKEIGDGPRGYNADAWRRAVPFLRLLPTSGATVHNGQACNKGEDTPGLNGEKDHMHMRKVEATATRDTAEIGMNGQGMAPVTMSSFLSTPRASSLESTMSKVCARLHRLLSRAKAERKMVLVYFNVLWRAVYAFGALGKAHLASMLEQLAATGEVVYFASQPAGLPGRESCVCLHPYLIQQAQATVHLYASYVHDRREDRGKLLTGTDLNECARCDPFGDAARGVFSQRLLSLLAQRLQLARGVSITVEIFALLLLLSDTVFVRRSQRPPVDTASVLETGSNCSHSNMSRSAFAENMTDASFSSLPLPVPSLSTEYLGLDSVTNPMYECSELMPSGSDSAAPLQWSAAESQKVPHNVEFVLPSLIQAECPHDFIHCVRRLAFANDVANTMISNSNLAVMRRCCATSRLFKLGECPPEFFSILTCRLYAYMSPDTNIYADALWLSSRSNSGNTRELTDYFLRGFVSLTHGETGETLLEMHFFSEGGGCLPLALLTDEVMRHVLHLMRYDFPGMTVQKLKEVPETTQKPLISDGQSSLLGKFSELTTTRELDLLFRNTVY